MIDNKNKSSFESGLELVHSLYKLSTDEKYLKGLIEKKVKQEVHKIFSK